jgi:hypothetical protein
MLLFTIGKIPSPQGDISVSWKRDGKEVELAIVLPQNVVAMVALPGKKKQTVTTAGTHSFTASID